MFFLIVLFVIVMILFLLFSNKWLEKEIESVGTSINGAKVELDGFALSLIDLRMKWNRLQVTDPNNTWRNLFETEKTEFDLALLPLFSKKFIIENIQLEGLKFNTQRKTDGKVAKISRRKPEFFQKIEQRIVEETAQMPILNLRQFTRKVNIDSLWRMIDLQSPQRIDSLKTNYIGKYENWKDRLNSLPSKKDFNTMSNQIQSIDIQKINTIEEYQKALTKTNELYHRVDSLTKSVKGIQTEFESDLNNVKKSTEVVQDWIKQDYQKALNIAQIPDLSFKNIGKLLFGERIIHQIQRVVGFIGTVRYYAKRFGKTKPEKEKTPRLQGQNIYFSSIGAVPKFWIKNVSMSGETLNGMQLSGKIKNIVSEQKLIKQATTTSLSGIRKDKASLDLNATFDYRGEESAEIIKLNLSKIPLSNVKLSNFELLPYSLKKGDGNVTAKVSFVDNNFIFDIDFIARNINFDYSTEPTNLHPKLHKLSRSITESLDHINFNAKILNEDGEFKFQINSNIDNLVATKVKSILSDEIQEASNSIKERIDREIKERQKELVKVINQIEEELGTRINSATKELLNQQALIQNKQKEIESQIEAEKKKLEDKLEDKAKDLIDDIFKK